jgi:DUF4097 and DUF4098 domain-containing protein YvlB
MRPWIAGALALLGLSACDAERVEETESEKFRFEAGAVRPTIEVRLEDGSIEVSGVEGSRGIEAEVLKRARSVDRESARRLLSRIEASAEEIEGGARIRFEGRIDAPPPFASDLRADLKLRVPRRADLDIRTEDGAIRIEGIEGRVRAETGDGRVFVERAAGELRLRTEDGSIVARNVEGTLEAVTGDGDVEIEGAFTALEASSFDGDIRIDCRDWKPPGEGWVVRTTDGAIRVELPAAAAADIDATAIDGRVVNRLDSFASARRDETDRRLRGKLGGGGPLLLFTSMDGPIELRQK